MIDRISSEILWPSFVPHQRSTGKGLNFEIDGVNGKTVMLFSIFEKTISIIIAKIGMYFMLKLPYCAFAQRGPLLTMKLKLAGGFSRWNQVSSTKISERPLITTGQLANLLGSSPNLVQVKCRKGCCCNTTNGG
jgi:hypothetical protein